MGRLAVAALAFPAEEYRSLTASDWPRRHIFFVGSSARAEKIPDQGHASMTAVMCGLGRWLGSYAHEHVQRFLFMR
jgi:hypothetical protein